MADYKFDRDRLAAQTIEHYMVNADEQWSFFKLMSKDGYGEVVRFSELSWFHSIDKHTKLAEQWKEVHWTVKLKRAEEQLFAVKSVNHEVGTGRRKSRDEQWNLDRSRHLESKVSTELRYNICQTEVHNKSSVGQAQAYIAPHTTHLENRSTCT